MSSAIMRSTALCIRANLFFQDGIWEDVDPRFDEWLGFSKLHFFAAKPKDAGPGDLQLATSPKEWFEQMKQAGITSLRLNQEMRNHPTIHDYKMAWSVDADKAWTVASRNQAEDAFGFWGDQTYMKDGERFKLLGFGGAEHLMARATPYDTANTLATALDNIIKFCEIARLEDYGLMFIKATGVLEGSSNIVSLLTENTISPYVLTAPHGALPELEINILRTLEIYSIFGGMGSWNDLSLPDDQDLQEMYHLTSKALHKALVEALVSVANARVPQAA